MCPQTSASFKRGQRSVEDAAVSNSSTSPCRRSDRFLSIDRLRLICVAIAIAAAAGAVSGNAEAHRRPTLGSGVNRAHLITTMLMTRAADGRLPNGPSRHAAVSGDLRRASVFAFESDATNLGGGPVGNLTNVYVVRRRRPYATKGTRWRLGPNELVSVGLGGSPANGRSYAPTIDGMPKGDPHVVAPSCVAFISDASNLVPGDTNGVSDAFVYYLASRRLVRVSVSTSGAQANGPTVDVAVNGDCSRVAFSSAATNLWRGVPRGTVQVYERVLKGGGLGDRGLFHHTFPLSVSRSGHPGNRLSSQPSFAQRRRGDVAFTSTSTNLSRGARSGRANVYVRQFPSPGPGPARRRVRTELVSATGSGHEGNGASSTPAFSEEGFYVAYQTRANDLRPGMPAGASQILRADVRGPRAHQINTASYDGRHLYAGQAANPETSNDGVYDVFDSDAPLFSMQGEKRNNQRVRNVFLYTNARHIVYRISQDSESRNLARPSTNPVISSRGNYIFFETDDPITDLVFVRHHESGWLRPARLETRPLSSSSTAAPPPPAATPTSSNTPPCVQVTLTTTLDHVITPCPQAPPAPPGSGAGSGPTTITKVVGGPPDPNSDPALHQIYMRYLGPE